MIDCSLERMSVCVSISITSSLRVIDNVSTFVVVVFICFHLVVRELLYRHCDVTYIDNAGDSALHHALRNKTVLSSPSSPVDDTNNIDIREEHKRGDGVTQVLLSVTAATTMENNKMGTTTGAVVDSNVIQNDAPTRIGSAQQPKGNDVVIRVASSKDLDESVDIIADSR